MAFGFLGGVPELYTLACLSRIEVIWKALRIWQNAGATEYTKSADLMDSVNTANSWDTENSANAEDSVDWGY